MLALPLAAEVVLEALVLGGMLEFVGCEEGEAGDGFEAGEGAVDRLNGDLPFPNPGRAGSRRKAEEVEDDEEEGGGGVEPRGEEVEMGEDRVRPAMLREQSGDQ